MIYRQVVADLHHFDEERDPEQDRHQNENSDLDAHQRHADPQHCIQYYPTNGEEPT